MEELVELQLKEEERLEKVFEEPRLSEDVYEEFIWLARD